MVIASTSQERLTYVPESAAAYGVVNALTPPQELRYVSHTLDQTSDFVISPEIESGAQVNDSTRLDRNAGGQIETCLSLQTWDDWLRYVARASTAFGGGGGSVTRTVTFDPVDNSITDTSVGDAFAATTMFGIIIVISGALNAANNTVFKVIAKVSGAKVIVSGNYVVSEITTANVVIDRINYIQNATTLASISIERQFIDLTQSFLTYTGAVFNTWALTCRPRDLVKMTWGFIAAKCTPRETTAFTGTMAAATTTPILNGVTDIMGFFEGGPSGDTLITSGGERLIISGVTTANPGAVTTTTNHRMETGDRVQIEGVAGATEANGVFHIVKLTARTFALYTLAATPASVNVAGTYSSGGNVRRLSKPIVLTAYDLNINNNIQRTEALAAFGATGQIGNRFEVNGSVGMYFESFNMLRKFLDADLVADESALLVVFKDSAGKYLSFDTPRIKFSSIPVPNAGINNLYSITAAFQAMRHTESGTGTSGFGSEGGKTLRISRKN